MAAPETGTTMAADLVERGAELLDSAGDRPGALRLRHALAIIRNDGRYTTPDGWEIPVSLMRMALALMDRDGHDTSLAAISLQAAIDYARNAAPLAEGEEIDPDLIGPFIVGASALR